MTRASSESSSRRGVERGLAGSGRQDLTQRNLIRRNALGIDDTIDHAIIVWSEIIQDPGGAHGGERKQRVLIHGTSGPGAFNRPPPQQIEIPQRSRGGLCVGEADQDQRLNEAEEGLSHNAHSTICATIAW